MEILNYLLDECKTELSGLGIKYGHVSNISINTRAVKRRGQCKRVSPECYFITVSNRLLNLNDGNVALKETIMHELLHTVEGCMNHGADWQYYADKVNRAYGYHVKRCTSCEEKGVKPIPAKYIIGCPCCDNMRWGYMRNTDAVKRPFLYHCPKCKKNLERLK